MSIKNRLKVLIEELKLKNVEFSKKTGIPYRTLQNYLLGQRQPSVENLKKVVAQFGVNPTWLLTGEGEMFISDKPAIASEDTGMPVDFIDKLREDLKDKGDGFYASLSMSKDKLFNVLLGKVKLNRVEVIELARKLNRSLDEYMYLSGYMPKEFEKLAGNKKAMGLFRKIGQLSDADIDQVITSMANTIKEYLEEKEKNKNRKL